MSAGTIGNFLEEYTYEYLKESILEHVPDDIDKREGSIIFDAIMPAAYELSFYYYRLRMVLQQTYAETAVGEFLDLRAAEQGLTRYLDTAAVRRGDFSTSKGEPLKVEMGTRFSTISETGEGIVYSVSQPYVDKQGEEVKGAYLLTCEEKGSKGNEYLGDLLPVTYVTGLGSGVMSTVIVPGRDVESDQDFRERYFESLHFRPFGGNIAQYRLYLQEIPGVGDQQIYPAFRGAGTVLVSIVDPQYQPVSEEFIRSIQSQLDPENLEGDRGDGLGIAPIGHKVTVVTPEALEINIHCKVQLTSDTTLETVRKEVEKVCRQYIEEVRHSWGEGDDYNRYRCDLYQAKVVASILRVSGIVNVRDVEMNGEKGDLSIPQTPGRQSIPILGEVRIDEH